VTVLPHIASILYKTAYEPLPDNGILGRFRPKRAFSDFEYKTENQKNGDEMITNDAKNILIADDSIFFRTKLSAILNEAGHVVTYASDGREVIAKLKENPSDIDIIILDLQMPHIDGFGAKKFPVLAVTGVYEPHEVIEKLKSLGARGLMTKGFTPEQVIHRINQILFPTKEEDRTEPRVPLSVAVDYTFDNTTYTGFLLNVSASGLFLHTRLNLLPGTTVELKFSLPTKNRIFNVKGIVRWSTPSSSSANLFGGAGIMFTSVTDEEKEELREFVKGECERLILEG
jgi:uncharacterized protein (TIGR02266 family)